MTKNLMSLDLKGWKLLCASEETTQGEMAAFLDDNRLSYEHLNILPRRLAVRVIGLADQHRFDRRF